MATELKKGDRVKIDPKALCYDEVDMIEKWVETTYNQLKGVISKEKIERQYTHGVVDKVEKPYAYIYLDIYPIFHKLMERKNSVATDYIPLSFDVEAVSLEG